MLLRQAAELLGETLSEFLIASGRERAERLVADRRRFVLDEAAWAAFNEALERPAELKPELRVCSRGRGGTDGPDALAVGLRLGAE